MALSVSAQIGPIVQPDTKGTSVDSVEALGLLQLKHGYADLAKNTCEAALKADPKNEAARECLDLALTRLEAREGEVQERTLNQAESLLQLGKKTEALGVVEKIQAQIHSPALAARAEYIVKRAGEMRWLDRVKQYLSEGGIAWILDVVTGAAFIVVFYWALKSLRFIKRKYKAVKNKHLGLRTRWRVIPILDETKVHTSSFVLSAYDSLKRDLSDSSNPILLFVPPFDGVSASRVLEIQVQTDVGGGLDLTAPVAQQKGVNGPRAARWYFRLFRSDAQTTRPEGFLALKQQNFEFLDALKELGVKVGGTDLSSMGKFVAAIGKWFDAGVPTLTGSAFKDSNRVVVSLTCSDAARFATVSAKGSDATVGGAQEAADAAVYKMLYLLGHQGSDTRDADAAAELRRQIKELEPYLSGELPGGEKLNKLCHELAETRRRIAMSRSVPEYVIDRALMWEATARFLHGDLERALDLLEQLRDSKGRIGLKHDKYNAAVVCRLLGNERLESAHARLAELGEVSDAWGMLADFERVYLLTSAAYRNVWDRFQKDVSAWKASLLRFVSSTVQQSDNEVGNELRRLRPPDTVVWNAILTAELDYPVPSRPADRPLAPDGAATLAAAEQFFKNSRAASSGDLADNYLQLSRVYLYRGMFAEARESVEKYKERGDCSKAIREMAAYVKAEVTYNDTSLTPVQRSLRARELIRTFDDSSYAPIQALKAVIDAGA